MIPPPPAAGPFGFASSAEPRPARSRRAFAASLVAASLLVGGVAGVGGAAAYSTWLDDGAGSSVDQAVATSPVVSTAPDTSGDTSVEQVATAVLPSVVKLDVKGAQEAGSGSGIILSSDGLILTNNHVAEVAGDGGSITVSFEDGSEAPASIVGTDPLTDVAVVKAEGVSDLTPATIGTSGDLRVGQDVVAIGSPFGLDATVTSGIVSALNRPVDVGRDAQGNVTAYPAVQTDAAINPGNSGGPLVDAAGHVVGINASIRTGGGSTTGAESGSIGLGFAIPIDEVLPIVDQLEKGDTPTHAQLGISVSPVEAAADSGAVVANGAEVQEINDGSAAGSAGLEAGDVITKIDDTQITSVDSLIATIRSYRPGDDVSVTYLRGGSAETTTITLDSDASTS